jgi:HSP20 family protein
MAIVRWNPAGGPVTMRDLMDRLMMDDAWGTAWGRRPVAAWGETVLEAPVDVYQTDTEYVVKASMPGVKPDDVDISIIGETLTVKAALQEDKEVKAEGWLVRESRHGAFARSVTLPTEVQADKVEAILEHGILTLKLPKAEAVVPKTIKVKTASE